MPSKGKGDFLVRAGGLSPIESRKMHHAHAPQEPLGPGHIRMTSQLERGTLSDILKAPFVKQACDFIRLEEMGKCEDLSEQSVYSFKHVEWALLRTDEQPGKGLSKAELR